MKNFTTLLAVFVRDGYKNKVALGVMLGIALFLLVVLVTLICALALVPELDNPSPDLNAVGRWLTFMVYGAGILGLGINLNVFSANPLFREKQSRIFESLLAAPVTVRRLWTARSLAVFLPGLLFCEVFAAVTYFVVNIVLLAPKTGFFFSPVFFVNGFLLAPLVYLPLHLLVVLVGLAGNPVSGNVIAQIFLPLAINLAARSGLGPASADFLILHLCMTALFSLAVVIFQTQLTKERVVLSLRK